MLKQYIIFAKTKPFPGYLVSRGKVRLGLPLDGTTIEEYLDRLGEDRGYALLDRTVNIPDRETHKWDEATKAFVLLDPGDVTPDKQDELDAQEKARDIIDKLPSWGIVENVVNNITSLAEAKAYLLKLSRVVYWLAKGKPE